MPARRTAALTVTTAGAVTALTLLGAATAAVAGSDSPTPYRVTGVGIELPGGDAFAVHDHVNVTYVSALGAGSRNVHIEGPGSRFGDLAGASTLTWDRAGLPPDACVTWVQVAGYDEHHGEGGQAPVCRTSDAPPVPPAPVAPPAATTPPPATTAPSAPAAPVPPATSPAPTAPAAPSAAPGTPAAPAPVAPSAPQAMPTAEVAAAPASPAPTERAEVLSAGAATPGPTPTQAAQVRAASAERSDVLAATGARTGTVLGVALVAVALGAALVAWRRRTARP